MPLAMASSVAVSHAWSAMTTSTSRSVWNFRYSAAHELGVLQAGRGSNPPALGHQIGIDVDADQGGLFLQDLPQQHHQDHAQVALATGELNDPHQVPVSQERADVLEYHLAEAADFPQLLGLALVALPVRPQQLNRFEQVLLAQQAVQKCTMFHNSPAA